MAAVVPPSTPRGLFRADSEVMNTIPDPRTPSPSSNASRNGSTDSIHHPELSDEVALLSTKLVNAINNQTHLDDALQAARHELEAARERSAQLEAVTKRHAEMIDNGQLIRREAYDAMQRGLRKELEDERKLRGVAEKEKRRIESELETLTTALFEEANSMVAAARKEREASERRNEQLKNQLNDTELLLASHQEQLQDLKAVMQQLTDDRGETEAAAHTSTAPSTPGAGPPDGMTGLFEAGSSPAAPGTDEAPPDHPLRFSHLVRPVLRTDIQAYDDFHEFLRSANSAPPSRVPSGNYGGLNVMGLGALAQTSQINFGSRSSSQTTPKTASSPALPASGGNSPREGAFSSLKENKFYKRALAEDIEPTLRLDIAPGLSWLARRTVLNSMTAGSLVVDPQPPTTRRFGGIYACSLCGESRKDDKYARQHRFRTSESDDAQRYPLCDYCVARVRAACDYIGFLRLVNLGHWKAETEDEVRSAWEESVRLRERMFWARVGGGVVPASAAARDGPKSPASTLERAGGRKSEESVDGTKAGSDETAGQHAANEDPFRSDGQPKRISIGRKVISRLLSSSPAPTSRIEVQKSHHAEETKDATRPQPQAQSLQTAVAGTTVSGGGQVLPASPSTETPVTATPVTDASTTGSPTGSPTVDTPATETSAAAAPAAEKPADRISSTRTSAEQDRATAIAIPGAFE